MALSTRFLFITSIFITSLITANIMIVKQVAIGPITIPAAIIIFPISYICGDILTEVYGYKRARQVIWLGFICNLIAVVAFWIGGLLPPAPIFDAQSAYERILGSAPRFLIASFIAYLIGEFSNAFVLSRLKIATKGKWLWTRTITSTLAGQGLDSIVVLLIAFIGTLPLSIIGFMIIGHWLLKTAYEIIITPVTYIVINYLKHKEQIDVFDYNFDYNPFRIN